MYRYIIVLLMIASVGICARLLTNGDFEQPIGVGWSSSIGSQTSYDTIDRATTFHPDLDYEARVKKYDATHARLSQIVTLQTINDVQFSAYARMYAQELGTSSSYWAAAAIVLRYLGVNNNLLAETRIAYKTPHCPWTNSNTLHIITVTDPNNWYTYSFNIESEFQNFPMINPNLVKKIEVALMDTTNGC